MLVMESELSGLVRFFHVVGKLKQEKRRGWVDRGVKNPESVADHSFMLALMALVFCERKKLDSGKAVKLALVHDLPEAVVGDVVTLPEHEKDERWLAEKHAREERALEEILSSLDEGMSEKIRVLWKEFEARETLEARLVYELDRLDAIFQAQEYAKDKELEARLQVFFDYGNSRLKDNELRKIFEIVLAELEKP